MKTKQIWWRSCLGLSLATLPVFAQTIGIVGGRDQDTVPNPAYAAIISSSGTATSVGVGLLPSPGSINSVAINASGNSIIGGVDLGAGAPFAALVSSSGTLTIITTGISTGDIMSVAINASGIGLIGGQDDTTPAFFAAFVSPTGTLTPITGFPATPMNGGIINSVSINTAGAGLVGGINLDTDEAYAALVSSGGVATSVLTGGSAFDGEIHSVAINTAGNGLIGGENSVTQDAYAALVSSGGVVTSLLTSPSFDGTIESVAINASGNGLIGGLDTSVGEAYAALVSSGGVVTPLLTGAGIPGSIDSVSINSSGKGLIGNEDYAAFVSPTGVLTPLALPTIPTPVDITSVAITDGGNGLIGGNFGTNEPFVAFVSSSGVLVNVTGLFSSGSIRSVAIFGSMLDTIPTTGLTGNNLILADYINANSPDTAFFFAPASIAGTLSDALEAAAPTRNAFDLFIADSNLFALNGSFTQHIEDTRHYYMFQEKFCADRTYDKNTRKKPQQDSSCACEITKRPHQIWFKALGTTFRQKAQDQTPTFQPWIAGGILGFDAHSSATSAYGLGAAYAYSRNHQKQGAGHSHINQEYLFVYGLWDSAHFYGDAAIWAGLFQISNRRHIKMTAFDFRAASHPKGWQLAPHAEIGYHRNYNITTVEPFAMFDWVSNWQGSYQEKGSGPLNFGQKSSYSSFLRSELGLRLYETIEFQTWRLILQEKGSYVNRKPFHVGNVNAFLVGAPGNFTVTTLTSLQNLGLVEAKMLFESHNPCRPYGSVAYQGEFGSTYQSHQLSLNVGWNF